MIERDAPALRVVSEPPATLAEADDTGRLASADRRDALDANPPSRPPVRHWPLPASTIEEAVLGYLANH